MVKITIEYKRKSACTIRLEGATWLNSLANMLECGLLKGASCVWAWEFQSGTLWRYTMPEK